MERPPPPCLTASGAMRLCDGGATVTIVKVDVCLEPAFGGNKPDGAPEKFENPDLNPAHDPRKPSDPPRFMPIGTFFKASKF